MSCPEDVWFANQTHDHACATVSLLNIVLNIPDADLGENLTRFKDFTKTLTPALRGDQIGNFECVKQIHNSFARYVDSTSVSSSGITNTCIPRKMDMLNIDLSLQNAYVDRAKSRAKLKPKPKPKSKPATPASTKKSLNKFTVADPSSSSSAEDLIPLDPEEDDSAFHFIAYVPIGTLVYKLDGLDRQPQKLASYDPDTTDWMSIVKPNLEDRMAQYTEGQIQFVLLSLVKDPLISQREELVRNIKHLELIEERLARAKKDWEKFANDGSNDEASKQRGLLRTADLAYGITNIDVEEFVVAAEFTKNLEKKDVEGLMKVRQELVAEQTGLRQTVRDEQEAVEEDERRTRERRFDYGPLIHTWLKMLADKEGDVMKDLIEEVR